MPWLVYLFWLSLGAQRPLFLYNETQEKLFSLATNTSKIPILELFAAVATIYRLRDGLWGRKVLLFVDIEAACSALTEDATKNKVALLAAYTPWAVAARYNVAVWVERVPTEVNQADSPPRNQKLSSETVAQKDLATIAQLFRVCDSPRVLQQAGK